MAGNGKGEIKRDADTKIKDGDILRMKVCHEKGEIEWMINGSIEYRYSMPRLTDRNIEWVPFVLVYWTNT